MSILKTLWNIIQSFFSLPAWVIIWIVVFLIPANFAGFWFLELPSGIWIAGLGAGSILFNLILVWLNKGFSKALALPHLVCWIPLCIYLWMRISAGSAVSEAEQILMLICAIINTISLGFDVKDGWEWLRGQRDVAGFEGQPVRF